MPIYEYQCEACSHQLEVLQKISAEPLVDCPECGKSALRKKVSAAAFRLKGGGWYETDFKSSGQKNLASGSGEKADSTATPKKADSPASSSDSGPSKSTA